MDSYSEKFINHDIHSNLNNVKSFIDKLLSDDNVDNYAIDHLSRLAAIVSKINSDLKSIDPYFCQIAPLNKVSSVLTNITKDLNNFATSGDVSHLVTSNERIDNALSALSQIPLSLHLDTDEQKQSSLSFSSQLNQSIINITDSAKNFKTSIADFESKLSHLDKQLAKQENRIEKQAKNMTDSISNFQSQFSEAEDRRREKFENTISKIEEKYSNSINELRNDLENFKKSYKEEINQTFDKIIEIHRNRFNQIESSYSELFEDTKSQASNIINFLNEKQEEARRYIDVTGNILFTGNYNKIADDEKITANKLRLFAIIFMIAGVLIIGSVLFDIFKDGITLTGILTRIGITLTFMIPAFYLASESSKHRESELKNRKMELELASIHPYLELLPKDSRDDMKYKLTEKFFGRFEDNNQQISKDISNASIYKLMEKIMTILAKK